MAIQDDNLRDFLARRYSRRPAVISFIETPAIKLNEAELPNEGSTQDLWHAVLRLTKQMDTIQQLIAEVRRQYEKDAELIDKLAEAWLKGKDAAPVDINLANPYPGLRPFEEADRAQFFGRERWIKALSTSLDQHGFVTLYGGSGSGKSSLVRAGLMPRLKKEGHAVVLFTPGKNPFDSLLAMGLGNKAQAQKLIDSAQQGQLSNLFAELAAKCFPGQPLLIIMDQGEELYTRCENAELRERFLQCLFHDRGPSTRVLIGIREDFFDRWNKTRAHDPDFGATNLSLTAPDEDDWRAIIIEPARQHGVMFEAELPDRMIERLRNARSGLPLLQFLLQKLWEHDNPADGVLNQESYDSLGGVDHALRGHVEAFIARYPGRESEIRQMLFKLVRFTRQDGQYRALSRSCPVKDLPKDLADALVGDEWRLLTTRGQAGEVELSHEVILRVWPGFEKLEQERGALHALKSDITDATARWQPQKHKTELWAGSRLEESLKRSGLPGLVDDATTSDDFALAETPLSDTEREFLQTSRTKVLADRQFQKRLLIGVTITAVIMLLIAAGAGWFWKEAEEQKGIANEQKGKATKALSKAQKEEARAEQLTREVVLQSASKRGNDESLEAIRDLAKSPDLLQTWEGRFLAKKHGFAPMKLRRKDISLLDQGALKGSGLYQAAMDLYDGKGAFQYTSEFPGKLSAHGITFTASHELELYQDAGHIPLLSLGRDTEDGHCRGVWLAPDRSCFLVRADLNQIDPFELLQADQEDATLTDNLYLIPLPEQYSSAALLPVAKEGEENAVPDVRLDFLKIQAGGRGHFLAWDDGQAQKGFFLRFDNTDPSGRAQIEISHSFANAARPMNVEQIRLALPKDRLAAFDAWYAEGAVVKCVDWSKEEVEVGAYLDGHFVVGPAGAPERMKKFKLPDSPATTRWSQGAVGDGPFDLAFTGDGKLLIAFPYQDDQIAIFSRGEMKLERLISNHDESLSSVSEISLSVQLLSNHTGSLVWATAGFGGEGSIDLYKSESNTPLWYSNGAIMQLDVDSTDRLFAQNLRSSHQLLLRDGIEGPVLATSGTNAPVVPDLIREAPEVPGIFLLGDTLLRRDGYVEVMKMPARITLAPDWSWVAYWENGGAVKGQDDTGNATTPFLRIVSGLSASNASPATLADKTRDFQIQWFSSPEAQRQMLSGIAGSPEAREAALLKRLDWPRDTFLLTVNEFEELRKKAPEIVTEAEALLKERPSSTLARFIKTTASFLATGNAEEASREIIVTAIKSEKSMKYPDPWHQWCELATLVVAKGGRIPTELGINESGAWMCLRELRAAKHNENPEWLTSFETTERSDLLAKFLTLSHLAQAQGKTQEAHQYIACIRLLVNPPDAWFTASLQARSFVKDPASTPLWLSLCPESVLTSWGQIFQTLPPDQDPAKEVLAIAKALWDRQHPAAQSFTQLIQSVHGLEVAALQDQVSHGVKVEINDIRVPEDAPVEARLAWLGRLALDDSPNRLKNTAAAKFNELRAGRTLQQLTDDELRGYFCILLSTLSPEKPSAGKWDEARSVLKLMQSRQPALNAPEKLKSTSWTNEEESAINLLLQGPPNQ